MRHSWMSAGAASGDLLYVSDDGYGSVMVYSYGPRAITFVGVLSAPIDPGPMCVDKQQNIWILGEAKGTNYSATEYAHGGTTPIAVLTDPAGVPVGCATDPTTGNLALASNPSLTGGDRSPTVAVYRNGSGNPKIYQNTSTDGFYGCCAYDHSGNFYAAGEEATGGRNVIQVLPKGSKTFTSFTLDREVNGLYGMQWVGKYFTVSDSFLSNDSSILEYTVSSKGVTFARDISLKGVTLLWQYYIDRNRIIAPNAPFEGPGSVGLFKYSDGAPIRTFPFSIPVAVVVSRAPK